MGPHICFQVEARRMFDKIILLIVIAEFGNVHRSQAACPHAIMAGEEQSLVSQRDEVDEADPDTTTPNGCKCSSHCSCGVTCNVGEVNDWCSTDNKCGQWTLGFGYWDYCQYLDSTHPDYLKMSWEDKTNKVMENVKASPPVFAVPNTAGIMMEAVNTAFDNQWDTMPLQRVKYIHSIGAVCKFTIDISQSPYTGMLKDGKHTGIVRLGSGNTDISDGKGVAPGGGIKFMRTGRTSANFMVLNSLSGGPSYDFFKLTLANHIPSESGLAIAVFIKKFKQASKCPGKVGLRDLTMYDQDGNEETDPKFPFKLSFVPTGKVHFNEEPAGEDVIKNFYQQFLDKIDEGTELYSVVAHASPDDEAGTELGKLVTADKCHLSQYGDEKLFFQHQRIEEDIQARPEWEKAYMEEC